MIWDNIEVIIINKKLIALDLDGTTLNNNSQLSELTIKTLKTAVAAGHVVSIVTGRPNRISEQFYDQLGLKSPMINFNGNLGILPHEQWPLEYEYNVDKDIVAELLSKKNELGIKLIAIEGRDLFMANRGATIDMGFFPTILKAGQQLTHQNLQDHHNPISITVAVEPEAMVTMTSYVETHFGDQVSISPWGGKYSIVEIAAKGIQKATGVKILSDYYGIYQADIIAIGDEHNDTTMIDYAGLGVAMKNAIPSIKNAANMITKYTNEEDGVAKFLNHQLDLQLAE